MKAKIQQDIKDAMRAKDVIRLSTLRLLSSAIHNREIEKRAKRAGAGLTDEEIIAVIRSEAKKRKDAIVEFEKGGRRELAAKETTEAKILEAYLPAEMGDTDLEKIVQEVIGGMDGVTQKDFGKIMGDVMRRVKGQASGDRVSGAVKFFLNK